jgi:hypothetical protein
MDHCAGQKIMKTWSLIVCTVFGFSCSALGHIGGDPGAPEVKGALKCELRPTTDNVRAGSRVWMSLTIENTSTLDVALPFPGSSEPGMIAKLFLVSRQATGAVEHAILPGYKFGDGKLTPEQQKAMEDDINNSWGSLFDERPYLPSIVLPWNATAEQQKVVEEKPTDRWRYVLQKPAPWISIPPHGTAGFQVFVDVSPKMDSGEAPPLNPGTCRLQCAIMYFVSSIRSAGVLRTNDLTSAEDIAKAKASGLSLVDDHSKLWTGKMESNVVPINVIGSPK